MKLVDTMEGNAKMYIVAACLFVKNGEQLR